MTDSTHVRAGNTRRRQIAYCKQICLKVSRKNMYRLTVREWEPLIYS
jgi:hypothetical protein